MTDEQLARQYHSITMNQYNTWIDWRLIPLTRPVVNPPEVKAKIVEVPGADGALDYTELLDEKIHFKPREGSWEFLVCHEQIQNYDWARLYHTILNAVHGKRAQIILMDEWPESDEYADRRRLYTGRVFLNSFLSDPHHSKITFDYVLDPYRYLSEDDALLKRRGIL